MVATSQPPPRQLRPRRRSNYRLVKIHRNYSIEEAARLSGVASLTVRRWIKDELLPAVLGRKPILILGTELADFLGARSHHGGAKLQLEQCYCFKCRSPRSPALGFAEFIPRTPTTGNIRAFCEICDTVMNKAVSMSSLPALSRLVEVTIGQAEQHLMDSARASLNDHIEEERLPMRKHHPNNEHVKRDYFTFLEQAKRMSPSTVDQVAASLALFEQSTGYRDFRKFHRQQAIAFKERMQAAVSPVSGRVLAKATIHSRLMAMKAFIHWLHGRPGFRSCITYDDAEYFNPERE